MITILESIHPCVVCMNIEIASAILEICIVPEPATTSGPGLLVARDTEFILSSPLSDQWCHLLAG